jgi:hypothetical protein
MARQAPVPTSAFTPSIRVRGDFKTHGAQNTPQGYAALLEQARRFIPDVAITTDVMVGFPGENEVEFNEAWNLCATCTLPPAMCFPTRLVQAPWRNVYLILSLLR